MAFLRNLTPEKIDNPNLQQFFLPLLLDDYVNFDSGEREEKLIEQAIANGFLKDRNNSFEYAVLAISVEDRDGQNCTRPELAHSADTDPSKIYEALHAFAMDGRIISDTGGYEDHTFENIFILQSVRWYRVRNVF